MLQKYHWPGNIRELENLIKRYVILGNEEVISSDLAPREQDFFNTEIPVDGPISLKKLTRQAVRELERKVILKVLQNHHWNRKQAARALSISYRACCIRFAMPACHRIAPVPLEKLLIRGIWPLTSYSPIHRNCKQPRRSKYLSRCLCALSFWLGGKGKMVEGEFVLYRHDFYL